MNRNLSFVAATIFAVFLSIGTMTGARAQQPSSVSVTQHHRGIQSLTSNDYWIAFPQNYDDEPGKYIRLYLSSTNSTTAYVSGIGDTMKFQLVPGQTSTVDVPLGWEMKTSSQVESKAVHVWTDAEPIFVEFDSHNPYTSDASYVLPSMGWGKAYVVASYGSLYDGISVFDYPSEFVVLANQDNTIITITPSADIRGDSDDITVHPKGTTFTETLNAGQSVQYKCIKATSKKGFDLTGTRIMGSNPIGVIGASQCANIPSDYPYCDFVCEMMQPLRTWGTTYYTAPFADMKNGQTYLVIGSKDNQTIVRTDADSTSTYATLAHSFDYFERPNITKSSRWESDAPFLLMQYANSATYPDSTNALGDPFMMAVNAVDNFSSPVIFNVFNEIGNQTPYRWNANVVAKSGATVLVDGSADHTESLYDDHDYEVYKITGLSSGPHTVTSDEGVSVSVYGFGYDESVGFAAAIGVSDVNSTDTIPPSITTSIPDPFSLSITASDKSNDMSGLAHIEIDSSSNIELIRSQTFQEGSGSETGSFTLAVKDHAQPAHVTARVFDLAGNFTTIEKDFDAQGPTAAVEGPAMPQPSVSDAVDAASALTNWMASGSGASLFLPPTPNPANGVVAFHFALRSGSHVTLDIFDLLGQHQLSVLSGEEDAGIHDATADVRLLGNGYYFYRANVGGTVQSGRLIIAR